MVEIHSFVYSTCSPGGSLIHILQTGVQPAGEETWAGSRPGLPKPHPGLRAYPQRIQILLFPEVGQGRLSFQRLVLEMVSGPRLFIL